MTVEELIEELQRMPNQRVRVCTETYMATEKKTARHEVTSVSWQGSHVLVVESPREMR